MQREEDGGIVISCDFCGEDWDEVQPMIEGHRGSVLCLKCLGRAMDESSSSDAAFECRLCLKPCKSGRKVWGGTTDALLCFDCVRLAAKGFHKDRDTDFRWDPSLYPAEVSDED